MLQPKVPPRPLLNIIGTANLGAGEYTWQTYKTPKETMFHSIESELTSYQGGGYIFEYDK